MGKTLLFLIGILMTASTHSQDLKAKDVPAAVKEVLSKKFPEAANPEKIIPHNLPHPAPSLK
jgi:hypothetical protein